MGTVEQEQREAARLHALHCSGCSEYGGHGRAQEVRHQDRMTADLRRLAERSLADEPGTVDRLLSKENAQTILALLAERNRLERSREKWRDSFLTVESRVAALEEGLRPAIVAAYCRVKHGYIHGAECDSYNGQHIADEVSRALLDERDGYKQHMEEAYALASARADRVAALEEGLLEACRAECGPWFDEGSEKGKLDPAELADRIIARALLDNRRAVFAHLRRRLAAAPSEPPDEYMCPNCVTPWKCNGPHIPAALPAEVGDA